MANMVLDTANKVYSIVGTGTKDEIIAVASNILGGGINDPERMADEENMRELVTTKFRTQENETKYKQTLAVTSALIRGTLASIPSAMIIKKEDKDLVGLTGALEGYKRKKTIGRFCLYELTG